MWAAYYNRLEVAEVLLYYVANLNAKSNGGYAKNNMINLKDIESINLSLDIHQFTLQWQKGVLIV